MLIAAALSMYGQFAYAFAGSTGVRRYPGVLINASLVEFLDDMRTRWHLAYRCRSDVTGSWDEHGRTGVCLDPLNIYLPSSSSPRSGCRYRLR